MDNESDPLSLVSLPAECSEKSKQTASLMTNWFMELFVIIIFSIIMTKGPNPVAIKNIVGTAASCVPIVLIKTSCGWVLE